MGKTKMNIVSGEPETKKKRSYEEKRAEKALKNGDATPAPEVKVENSAPAEVEKTTISPKPNQDHLVNRGKKYKSARAKVDNKAYKLNDAVKLVCETSYSSFPGSVELHLVLNEGTVNNRIELPFATGIVKRVEIADDSTVEKLKTGKIDFDVLLTSPAMMAKLVPFAKLLGPRGLMPNPKNGTVVENPEKAKSAFSGNTVTIKTEKSAPLVHLVVAKTNQDEKEIAENIQAVLNNVGAKRITKAVASASMGPGVQIQVA